MSESALTGELRAFAETRVAGEYEVDPWGFDRDVYNLAARVARWRWHVDVIGATNLSVDGPALLVVNRRFGMSEPAVIAMGVYEATGRRVRPVGVPDFAVIGSLLRRVGGVLDAPAEIRGLLRAGEVVVAPCTRQLFGGDQPGVLRSAALGAALAVGAPVLPVAVSGSELGRSWRVRIGETVAVRPRRGVHLDQLAVELADAARDALAALLSEE